MECYDYNLTLISFYHRQTEPEQTTRGMTVLQLSVDANENPEGKLQEAIDSNDDFKNTFKIMSSKQGKWLK